MKNKFIFASLIAATILATGCGGSGFKGSESTSKPATSTPSVKPSTSTPVEKPSTSTSNKPTTPVDKLPEFDTNTEVTISFWHTMGDALQTQLDGIISRFNQIYPNITVNHEQIGDYNAVRDNVLKNIPVDATPNLAYCYPDHVALYRDARVTRTLDDYINDSRYGMAEGTIVQGFYEEGRTFGDGLMYSLPFVKSTEVLYYDANFFAKHSDKIRVPKTWDEMWEVCRIIKEEIDPTSTPLGYDSESNWFITHAEQYGYKYTSASTKVDGVEVGIGAHFQFNNKGNRDFVAELAEYFGKGYFTTEEIYGAYTSGLFTAATNRAYMGIGSTGGAQYQVSSAFTTGIATIPQAEADVPNRKDAVISQGPSICMFKKNNAQEELASWLFLRFLTTDIESQSDFAKASGYIPVSVAAQKSEGYQAYLETANGNSKTGVTALAAQVAVEQSSMYFTSPTFVGSSQARDEVGSIIIKVLSDKAQGNSSDISSVFADAVNACIEAVA